MPEIRATLKNCRQSPRKIRLLAGLVRGKSVPKALADLSFSVKKGSDPMEKLLRSAAANGKELLGKDPTELVIARITVDAGLVMKRSRPAARGRSKPIRRRSSTITVVLGEKPAEILKKKRSEKNNT